MDFILGTQYYRSPTPEADNWESDLENMKKLGLTHVKFWVQWRWCHRSPESFYFEDIDRLMDLAYQNNLKVTLNVIFDVAPIWLFREYPDCVQITADGQRVEPATVLYRQIGGFPGPCYNHEEAIMFRKRFLEEAVLRYRDHPAMDMWDVWNEPEQCSPYRRPQKEKITCFCPSCRAGFLKWLQEKYVTVDELNRVWGRCYMSWDEVELPTDPQTYCDFIDFKEFHLLTMTKEANWRIGTVKELDQKHPVYLHVVPDTAKIMNAVTGVDDFALAENCDVFGSTNFASPIWSVLTLSAGKNKICYNVECHIGNGSTRMHQKQIRYEDLLYDFIPQIGLGIRGFMFWQYRAEILGLEAPGWGMTNLDGSPGSVGKAAALFAEKLLPVKDRIMKCPPPKAEIAVWKGCRNEIFQWAVWNELDTFGDALEQYIQTIYNLNYECCVVDDKALQTDGLDGIKLLILPECYWAERSMIEKITEFVTRGGHVLCEAHLGGYDADRGRHSYVMPGCGTAELFGIREEWTTAPVYLTSDIEFGSYMDETMPDDMKKAVKEYGISNGNYFPVKWEGKELLVGASRFAALGGEGLEAIGTVGESICIGRKQLGKGTITYCGTNLGEGAGMGKAGFVEFLDSIIGNAGIGRTMGYVMEGVHIDCIGEDMIVIKNSRREWVDVPVSGVWDTIFGREEKRYESMLRLAPESAELFLKR